MKCLAVVNDSMILLRILLIPALVGLISCAVSPDPDRSIQKQPAVPVLQDAGSNPEPATTQNNNPAQALKQKAGSSYVAVTANPHASSAAGAVLERGGSAIDAAIAAQMVLGLVEPQSSGIGGGAFLLYWDNTERRLYSYDGRETAPQSATEKLFLDSEGKPLGLGEAIVGGRSVGVPGLLRMLELAHSNHGSVTWRELFDEAIDLAENGFAVSPRLHTLIERVPLLDKRPVLRNYLFENEEALQAGSRLKNIEYAVSLQEIAEQGADYFYGGELARAIVDTVNRDDNPGSLSLQDLAAYSAAEREPVCQWIFGYNICGMGPPSSGATTVLGILGQLEQLLSEGRLKRGDTVSGSVDAAHAFIEAMRLAFADRNTYLADPDFIAVPVDELLEKDYLAARAALIDPLERTEAISAGKLNEGNTAFVTASGFDLPSTTHLSIVDSAGNIASLTSSIETAFGSRLMTNGFILNNQLTDFSFSPVDKDGGDVANRVEGGKRPLSSMSPMIIFNKANEPVMVIGSPGGKSIIAYVARVIYDHIVGGNDLYEAINGKHVVDTGRLRLEEGIDDQLVEGLRAKGHQPALRGQSSGIHALHRIPGGWQGVADPRREGSVSAR